MKKPEKIERGCPIRRNVDCFSFDPVPTSVDLLDMTPEQVAEAGITKFTPLVRCTECSNVFYVDGGFAHIIGTFETGGAEFTPSKTKYDTSYVGDWKPSR
jgi:hypothetical protein